MTTPVDHKALRELRENAVKHLDLITIYHEGNHELPPLLFEFAGICDVRKLDIESPSTYQFFLSEHPRHFTPSLTDGILYDKNRAIVFAFFFPTQRCNPDVTIGVMSDSFIPDYLEKYPFLKPVKEWKKWSEIIEHYQKEQADSE